MHQDQRQDGRCHHPGWRDLRVVSSPHPRSLPVRTHHVDRPSRGQLSHRGERIHLRALRAQGGGQRALEARGTPEQQQQQHRVGQKQQEQRFISAAAATTTERQVREGFLNNNNNNVVSGNSNCPVQGFAQENGLPARPQEVRLHRAVGRIRVQLR